MSEDDIQIRQRTKESKQSEEEEEEEEERPVNRKRKRTDEGSETPSTPKQNGPVPKPRKKKKKEGVITSKLIAYLMISPTIIYFLSISYDVISKYSLAGKVYHVVALFIGASIAAFFCFYFHKTLQKYLKYLAMASVLVFFIPTVQVYSCSPIHLNNSDIGKTFKLKENVDDLIKFAYHNQECWKKQNFKTPYSMSMYTPRIKIHIKPYQIINLMMHHFDKKEDTEDGPPPESLPYQVLLFASQRSVKRQMYNLNLLALTPGRVDAISSVLELSMDDRENITLDVTGTLTELGPKLDDVKKDIEEMEFLLRPLVFNVQQVDVFNAPEEQTENPEEYEADKSTWKKKQKPTGRNKQ